jgi:ACR3 family arsenite efflux pump ArsB
MTNRGEHTIECVLLCWSIYFLFSSAGHSIFCYPLLIILLSVLLCWSFYFLFSSVDNIMTNRGEQKIEWPTEENRQYNDQQRRTDNRMTNVLLCWSLYCLFSSVGHYIVCSPLLVILFSVLLCWSLYCLFSSADHSIVCSPLLLMLLSVILCCSWTENIMTNRGEQTI